MKKLVLLIILLSLTSCLSMFLNDGLTVKIRNNCKVETLKYVKENDGYKIIGDYIRCKNLQLKNRIIRFIVFHDDSDTTRLQYSKIKYIKIDNIVREAIVPNPYYTVSSENWYEDKIITQLDLDKKTDEQKIRGFNTIEDFDDYEIKKSKIEFKDINYYFIKYNGGKSFGIKYEFKYLRNSREFISYLIDNGFFVYESCLDGSLFISPI